MWIISYNPQQSYELGTIVTHMGKQAHREKLLTPDHTGRKW